MACVDTTKTYVMRKFEPEPGAKSDQFYDYPNTLNIKTVNGTPVVVTNYTLNDGQTGDLTVSGDGTIHDPVGLGIKVITPTTTKTGSEGIQYGSYIIILILVFVAGYAYQQGIKKEFASINKFTNLSKTTGK